MMIEKVEYKGRWWLPEKPDNKISGILTFTSEEGAILDLDGVLENARGVKQMTDPEIILGETNDGIVTIYKCIAQSLGGGTYGDRSSYHSDIIFVGIHFHKTEDVKFNSISIHYSHLDEWLNITGFHGLSFIGPDPTLKYSQPEPIKVIINENYILYFSVSIHKSSTYLGPKKIAIEEDAYITIESQGAKSFEAFREVMGDIENFLSLGVMKPVYPLVIYGKATDSKNTINIFYSLWCTPEQHKALAPFDMLFTYKDISNKFENILKLWFEKANILKSAHLLYFSTLYNSKQYLDYNFLSYVFALESYHRTTDSNSELPQQEHNKRLEQIFTVVPAEHKEWLKKRLAYSNEPSFRKRLNDIYDKSIQVIENFINYRNVFIQKVIDTRNYLVHHDMGLKDNTAKGQSLVRLTLGLKLLLEVCLLIEIGFDPDQINTLFSKYSRYRFYKENRILSLNEKIND